MHLLVKKKKDRKNTPWCSHLFPVFSSANCSCLSIYVKPAVHVSSHPDGRFPQSTCSCLLRSNLESPSLASRYIFKVQADQQVCTALQKNPLSLFLSRSLSSCVRSLSRSASQFLCCYRLSLSHTDYQKAATLLMMMSSLLVLLVEAE